MHTLPHPPVIDYGTTVLSAYHAVRDHIEICHATENPPNPTVVILGLSLICSRQNARSALAYTSPNPTVGMLTRRIMDLWSK